MARQVTEADVQARLSELTAAIVTLERAREDLHALAHPRPSFFGPPYDPNCRYCNA